MNASLGVPISGDDDQLAQAFDGYLDNLQWTAAVSAGNIDPPNTAMRSPGIGYNTISVAAADKATQFGIGTISAQLKNLDQTTIKLRSREADAQKRLDYRREQLVAQFTRMEVAISRLNAQRGALSSSINALTGRNN